MKNFITLLITISSFSLFSQSTINNLDFEDSTFNNWLTTYGKTINYVAPVAPHPYYVSDTGISLSASYILASHLIIDSTGNDMDVSAVSILCPFTGSNSVRLGNYYSRAHAESMETLYTLTASDSILEFYYAYVSDDPNHPLHKNAYFFMEIYDSSGGTLTLVDSVYVVSNSSALTPDSNHFNYQNWTTESFNLSSYIGHNMLIRVTNGDCTYGGHEGRVYFDFSFDNKVSSTSMVICRGDSILFGGNYIHNTGYYFDTTWAGGSVSKVSILGVHVKNSPLPLVNIAAIGTDLIANVTSGTSPYSYKWYRNSVLLSSTNSVYTPLLSGNFKVMVEDSEGCESTNSISNYHLSLEDLSNSTKLSFFPNPTKSKISLDLKGTEKGVLKIINNTGKLVQSHNVNSKNTSINLEFLSKGIYFLSLEMNDGTTRVGKVILE